VNQSGRTISGITDPSLQKIYKTERYADAKDGDSEIKYEFLDCKSRSSAVRVSSL
jgi:hypothetical protein